MFYVSFNNKNSFNDLGLKIPRRPNIPVPEQIVNSIPVEGRNGSLTKKLGYKDIEISIEFNLINRNNINDSCRQVKAWLMNINKNYNENKLIFSDDLNYFYKVKYIKFSSEIERILKVFGRFTAIFVCDPFSYLDGFSTITITKASTINNDGTYWSEPILKIYGQGDITLTINNKNINLYSIQDYITIDSVIKNAYKDTLKLNGKMLGNFPLLLSGSNSISWVGNVTKIEIQKNSRYL